MAVRLEKQDSIGHIVLDRPPANSYDQAFMDELDAAIDEAGRDDGVKAILLRSASEKFFSAGADVSVFAKSGLDDQTAFVARANAAMGKFESTSKVVVVAINGHCLGGGLEMALCCDFRIAAEGSYRIGLPEVSLGLLPGTGGTQRLPRLIGRQRALDFMLRGTTMPPQDALAAGIVDEVVPSAELLDKALERVRAYATGPTFAIGLIKKAVVQGFGMRLDEGLKLERQLLIELFKSEDAKEGVTAFVEKRKPTYKGR
jgi:enoyl-CoA hydratase/carnithine racemase